MSGRLGTGPRVRAPELLPDGFWLNTAGPLGLAALRGRFVLLDFWTFACANCWHVADELRPVEQRLADVLTVVGVHSPKFPHEADPHALTAAVERAGITHPVLNDPDLVLWRQYAVRAWPTLVLVDPEGYVIAQAAGEGQADALAMVLADRLPTYEQRGTLRRGAVDHHRATPPATDLRFPASGVVLPAGRTGRDADTLLVADAGHHQLVELTADGTSVLRRIGSGTRGQPFIEPNGLTLLPPGGPYDVLVADTGNHVLRGVRLADGAVTHTVDLPRLLAGARTVTGPVPAVLSPWDVAWWPAAQRVVVSASGVHLLLSYDPATDTAEVLAGTTVEGLRDGPALDGWLAQPSGLSVDGDRVWFADAETSALRYLTLDGTTPLHTTLRTTVGEGLFDFGLVDGPIDVARMQHPLGVHVRPDGTVLVADTFNGAVRRWDPATRELGTVATGLAEPSGLVDGPNGDVLVVESAAHRLVPLVDSPAASPATADRVAGRPVTVLRPGTVELTVAFTPAPGRKVDDSDGPPVRLDVGGSPDGLLHAGGGGGTELVRHLELAGDGVGGVGVLSVTAQVASCDDVDAAEHPACYLSRQDWGIPVRIDPDGDTEIRLVLFGD